jgi:hypothetical protein
VVWLLAEFEWQLAGSGGKLENNASTANDERPRVLRGGSWNDNLYLCG